MRPTTAEHRRSEPGGLRRLAATFVCIAVAFFPLIMNPLTIGFFDAATDAERLAHAEDNLGGLRFVFTAIGVTEFALGAALWAWGRRVARATAGGRRRIAIRAGVISVVAGGVALVGRLAIWIDTAEDLASDELSARDFLFGFVNGVGFAIAFWMFGYLMIRGSMPTWLGAVWIGCGVMFWVGILPLWFFVGALVFGIHGLVRFRDPSHAPSVSADTASTEGEVAAPSAEAMR